MTLLSVLLALAPLSALGLPAGGAPAPVSEEIIKLATLVPDGSLWDKSFRRMGEEWRRDTEGRVQLRIYGGGVAGDEPDIIRKMRIGQLGGASLTVSGMGEIDEAFNVFQVPLLFESMAEVMHVVERMTPLLRERLEKRGFILLGWGHTGWVHIFSTEPVRNIDDLRRLKLFVWGSKNQMVDWWKENGFRPVPLAATDILPALETGMIEAVPATPLATLSLQWFRSTPYMMEDGIMPYLGATIVSRKTWQRVSEEDRVELLAGARRVQEQLFEEVPKHEAQAIEEMKKRGVDVVPTREGEAELRAVAASFAEKMHDDFIPSDVLAIALRELDAYRASHASDAPPAGE